MRGRLTLKLVPIIVCTALGMASLGPASAMLTAEEARKKAGELKNVGVKAYLDGRLAEAIENLSAAIDINLNDFFAHYYLGLALRDTAGYARAREILEVAADLDPRYLAVYVALGDVALGKGDPGTSRAWYQQAINRQANYAPAMDGLGRLAEARGDEEKAIERYKEAIQANRGFPQPYVHLGDVYRRTGRLHDALDMFQQAIKFRPDFAPAYRFLGVTYGELGRRNQAISFLDKAIELEPENSDLRLDLARLLLEWDDAYRARVQFEAAVALAPGRGEPLVGMARLERHEENFNLALDYLDRALAAVFAGESGRIQAEELRERYEDARQRSTRLNQAALEAADDAGAARAYLELARLHRDAGDHPDAMTDCLRALDPLGRPVELVFECGYYALEAGDYGPAADLLAEVVERDPSDERAQIDLGLAYSYLGRLASAAAVYRGALELNPQSVEASIYLANTYYRLGLFDRANTTYRQALGMTRDTETLDHLQAVLLHLQEMAAGLTDSPAAPGAPAAGRSRP